MMDEGRMAFIDPDDYELFLLALGVEEKTDIDYFSMLYLPAFHIPIYASIQLNVPSRVKLHIPIDQWYTKEYLDSFEHYWETEKYLSIECSQEILSDAYQLKEVDFVDHWNTSSRDGFAALCKGLYKKEEFCFYTCNPEPESETTHCNYLWIFRKALQELFPNIMTIQSMKEYHFPE